MVIVEPATKVVGPYFRPVPSAASNWPVDQGAVDVPVPPLATDSWPVKLGTKVKVLAVEVLMEIKMLVSEEVAMWMPGPVRAEMEVKAEVK